MSVRETLTEIKSKLTALLTYSNGVTGESDTSIGDAIQTLSEGYGGQALPISLELVDTWTGYLPEYTDTQNTELTDTNINITNQPSDHLYFLYTITCDGNYSSFPTAWAWSGASVGVFGRYNTNLRLNTAGNPFFYRINTNDKLRPQSTADLQSGIQQVGNVATIVNNVNTVQLQRRATNQYTIMGGNYTINVYAIIGV